MDEDSGIEQAVLHILRNLPGVRVAEPVPPSLRSELLGLATPAAAENQGVQTVLSRARVACVFKAGSFRGPPGPSLLLMDDRGTVLGRELTGPEDRPAPGDRRTVYLGRDFVLVHGVRPSGRMHFVLPPLGFPELDGVTGIHGIVSGSPDSPQDERLRQLCGVDRSTELASLLIGYDLNEG